MSPVNTRAADLLKIFRAARCWRRPLRRRTKSRQTSYGKTLRRRGGKLVKSHIGQKASWGSWKHPGNGAGRARDGSTTGTRSRPSNFALPPFARARPLVPAAISGRFLWKAQVEEKSFLREQSAPRAVSIRSFIMRIE